MRLRRFVLPLAGLAAVLVGVLAFGDLNGDLVYYLTPSEATAQRAEFDDGRRFRLAGMVAPDSVRAAGEGVTFTMTDESTELTVQHEAVPPQLFQEDIQVVVEGTWHGETFVSDTMLVKHDEEYYPPDEDHPDDEELPGGPAPRKAGR